MCWFFFFLLRHMLAALSLTILFGCASRNRKPSRRWTSGLNARAMDVVRDRLSGMSAATVPFPDSVKACWPARSSPPKFLYMDAKVVPSNSRADTRGDVRRHRASSRAIAGGSR